MLRGGSLAVHSPILGAIGALVFVSGIAVAIWARVHLGRNWGMPMTQKAEPELVTSGPYRFVRHPIYSGLLLALVGTALATNLLGLIIAAVLGGVLLLQRLGRGEEPRRDVPDGLSGVPSADEDADPIRPVAQTHARRRPEDQRLSGAPSAGRRISARELRRGLFHWRPHGDRGHRDTLRRPSQALAPGLLAIILREWVLALRRVGLVDVPCDLVDVGGNLVHDMPNVVNGCGNGSPGVLECAPVGGGGGTHLFGLFGVASGWRLRQTTYVVPATW